MQELVGYGTEFYAYSITGLCLLERLHEVRVLHERVSMANALGLENHCVV